VAVDGPATANVMLGSLSTSVTATLTGVSPVGSSSTSHAVEASYAGDSYYSSSTSATTSLTPQPVPTTLGLGSSASTVTVGGQVTLTATVTPGSAGPFSKR
jgi:homoserine kinase